MKHLAYCILPEQKFPPLPRGPDGEPLRAVVEAGLALVFAHVTDAAAHPAVPELLAYARVIEALHQHGPVLPMRYGCLFDNKDQLYDFLCRHQAAFQTRLCELEGCSEMSLRVLSPDAAGEESEPQQVVEPEGSGAAYLAARRTCYLVREDQRRQATRLSDKVRQAFQGLFCASRTEQPATKGCSIISLHFLVPSEFIEPLRAAFHQLQLTTSQKLLLSGPWPPYNFANSNWSQR
jgi:hypothetical protein